MRYGLVGPEVLESEDRFSALTVKIISHYRRIVCQKYRYIHQKDRARRAEVFRPKLYRFLGGLHLVGRKRALNYEEHKRKDQASERRSPECDHRLCCVSAESHPICAELSPVHEAYTEQDRYNADFNKRFKEAMKNGDAEAIKNLSREFTEKILPLVDYVDPEGLENTDAEGIERKYINSGNINYRRIKLCMLSNVNHASNTNFPLLKVGLDELKEKDPLKYAQITGKLSVSDDPVIDSLMLENGYNTESMIPSPEAQDLAGLKVSTDALTQFAKDRVREAEEEIAKGEHAKREKELTDTKNRITAKSAQRARKLDEEEDKRIEAIKRSERERIVNERIKQTHERLEREKREQEERERLEREREEREERERLEREKKEQE